MFIATSRRLYLDTSLEASTSSGRFQASFTSSPPDFPCINLNKLAKRHTFLVTNVSLTYTTVSRNRSAKLKDLRVLHENIPTEAPGYLANPAHEITVAKEGPPRFEKKLDKFALQFIGLREQRLIVQNLQSLEQDRRVRLDDVIQEFMVGDALVNLVSNLEAMLSHP